MVSLSPKLINDWQEVSRVAVGPSANGRDSGSVTLAGLPEGFGTFGITSRSASMPAQRSMTRDSKSNRYARLRGTASPSQTGHHRLAR
jgi:hypothetical protein